MLIEAQDRDLARYLDLHAGLNRPLPHLEAHERRAQRDRRDAFQVPHIDAEARARLAQNAYLDRVDGQIRVVFTLAGVIALATAVGGALSTIGGVL